MTQVIFMRGQRFDQMLAKRIEACSALVVVMTPAAADSDWVANEIRFAMSSSKPVLPLLLDGKPLLSVASLDHEDVHGGRMPGQRFLSRSATACQRSDPTDRRARGAARAMGLDHRDLVSLLGINPR